MFGEVLKEMILSKFKNQKIFSEYAEISTGHLADIVKGRSLPKLDKLENLIKALEPLSQEKKDKLKREWGFDKSENILRKEFEKLENKNNQLLGILNNIESEDGFKAEMDKLRYYENVYNTFFKNLSSDETKTVLRAMLKELKLISLEKGNLEKYKSNFKEIENIIKSL